MVLLLLGRRVCLAILKGDSKEGDEEEEEEEEGRTRAAPLFLRVPPSQHHRLLLRSTKKAVRADRNGGAFYFHVELGTNHLMLLPSLLLL